MHYQFAYAKLGVDITTGYALSRFHRDTEEDLDMDSFMASLVHRTPDPATPKRHAKKSSDSPHIRKAATSAVGPKSDASTPSSQAPKTIPAAANPVTTKLDAPEKNGNKKVLLTGILLIAVIAGITWGAFKFLPGLSGPKNPFDQSLRDEAGFPLYYPTKLPSGYQMELGSITRPEKDVVLYAVSNDTGQRFNITLQKQPADINLDPLYTTLKDVREISTSFGTVKVGNTAENQVMANVLAGQTWIIISGGTNLTDTMLTEVLNGLKI